MEAGKYEQRLLIIVWACCGQQGYEVAKSRPSSYCYKKYLILRTPIVSSYLLDMNCFTEIIE